jgi:SPP1 gp7 family putative phage head morphogenesis protein
MTFVDDVLYHVNREVSDLSSVGLARMANILDEAEQELSRKLAVWLSKTNGANRFTAQQLRSVLIQVRGALDQIRRTAHPVAHTLKWQSGKAADLALKHLKYEVEKFSSHFEGAFRPIPLHIADAIDDVDRVLYPRYASSAVRYAGEVGDHVRRQLALGVVQNETIDQMATRIMKLGSNLRDELLPVAAASRAQAMATGLFIKARSSAERLARTEVVHAYNAYANEQIKELDSLDPGYYTRWDAHIDRRLCLVCRALDGMVVKPGQAFPGGATQPPAHPNCRCCAVAWRKEWVEHNQPKTLYLEPAPGKQVPHSNRTKRRVKF